MLYTTRVPGTRYDVVWYCMELYERVRYGATVLYGMVRYGMVWYGMVWHGMVWYGVVWYGMVWCGMVWYGMVWYAMVWYAVVWFISLLVFWCDFSSTIFGIFWHAFQQCVRAVGAAVGAAVATVEVIAAA